jgi:hypothetical protein
MQFWGYNFLIRVLLRLITCCKVQHNFSDTKLSEPHYTASNAATTVNCELGNISTVHPQNLPAGTQKNYRGSVCEPEVEEPWFESRGGGKIYSSFWKCRDRLWSSFIIPLSVCGVSFRDSRRDMKLLPTPSSPEVENEWISTITTPYAFMLCTYTNLHSNFNIYISPGVMGSACLGFCPSKLINFFYNVFIRERTQHSVKNIF